MSFVEILVLKKKKKERNFGFVSLPVLTKLEGAFLGAESGLFCLYSSLVINPEGDAAAY